MTYINFPSVSPFSRAQPGVWEGGGGRAGPPVCLSAFLVYLWTQIPRENSSLMLPSSPAMALPESREEVLSQAAFCSQSHFACAAAALLIPFPNMLIGACGEQNLGVSSLSPDLGLKLKVCVQ